MRQLIVISSQNTIPGEHTWINKLFDGGLELLHLRKPGYSLTEVTGLLNKIDQVYWDRIAIHQYHEIGDSYNIKRLHFPEKERGNIAFDKNILYSTSVHSTEGYKELAAGFSYAFFSPVFNSISKENHLPVIGLKEAISVKSVIRMIALGGINAGNCLIPFQHGFDGVAVLGAVWKNKDPLAVFKQIQTCITKGLQY